MNEFVIFLILIVLATLLERLLKRAPPAGGSGSAGGAGEEPEATARPDLLPKELQDLIAEELGINLERRSRATPSGTELEPRQPPKRLTEVDTGQPPKRPAPSEPRRRARGRERRRLSRPPIRQTGQVVYPTPGRASRPRPMPEPVEITPAGAVISLEEQGMMERGEAVSLETPRTAAAHERFHDAYMDAPAERAARRGRRGRLPQRSGWTPVVRAVVWSEILGPPKGLTE